MLLSLTEEMHIFADLSLQSGQDLTKINFKDQSWLGLKTRSRKLLYYFNFTNHSTATGYCLICCLMER